MSSLFFMQSNPLFADGILRQKDHFPQLQARFVFDYNRGQRRKKENAIHQLAKKQYEQGGADKNFKIGFFKCPINRNPLRRVEDMNSIGIREINAVHHYKTIVSDNDVVILAGNQGTEYFTYRQDRAWIIRNCKPLADYMWDLLGCTIDFSHTLEHTGLVVPSRHAPDSEKYPERFI
jgi:hypothetical protein